MLMLTWYLYFTCSPVQKHHFQKVCHQNFNCRIFLETYKIKLMLINPAQNHSCNYLSTVVIVSMLSALHERFNKVLSVHLENKTRRSEPHLSVCPTVVETFHSVDKKCKKKTQQKLIRSRNSRRPVEPVVDSLLQIF